MAHVDEEILRRLLEQRRREVDFSDEEPQLNDDASMGSDDRDFEDVDDSEEEQENASNQE